MKRPVVIVDPLSSGIELAPAFRARGVPALAVTLKTEEWPEFGSRMRESDFIEVLTDQPGLEDILAKYNPIAVIPGTEEGIPLAERLSLRLTPALANDPGKAQHRANKALMQKALKEAGVPTLQTLHTHSREEAESWLREHALLNAPLVLKPPMSSGSEMVFHVAPNGDWRQPFEQILSQPSAVSGKRNEAVVIQEQAIGTEYAVGTVSANGRHALVHLIKYNKGTAGGRQTLYDHVEFVSHDREAMPGLFEYTCRALDALGVRWGATHTEVMLTSKGPRLIESSARMIGGPVVEFARAATGSSQADQLVELYLNGAIRVEEFVLRRTVVPVFLNAPRAGTIGNLEALERACELPTFLSKHLWVRNGDHVQQTVDYLTAIGIIALAGEREAVMTDLRVIRALESNVTIHQPQHETRSL